MTKIELAYLIENLEMELDFTELTPEEEEEKKAELAKAKKALSKLN